MAEALAKPSLMPALALLLAGCAEPPACLVEPGLESTHHGNAVCFVENERHVLLIHRRFYGDVGLPGGRRATGERSQCTAARETWEETGLAVIVGPLFERASNTSVYRCSLTTPISVESDPPTPWLSRAEIAAARWVPVSGLEQLNWRYTEQYDQIMRLIDETENP